MPRRTTQAHTPSAQRLAGGCVLLVGLLLLGPGLRTAHADDQTIEITVETGTSVKDLLEMTSGKLALQFIWSDHEKALRHPIQGRPVFRGSKENVFGSIRTLLMTYDLMLLPIGPDRAGQKQTFRVVDLRGSSIGTSLRADSVVLDERTVAIMEGQPWRYVTTTIHLENAVDLRNMRTALARTVTGSNIGQITEVPDARALVITDFAPKVVAAYRMVRRMDVKPPEPRTGPRLVVLKVEHARAKELARLIESLLVRGPNASVPRVVADERTNQLVVSGEAGPVSQIEAMIKQLDVPSLSKEPRPPPPPVTGRVVRLTSMDATEAANSLTIFVRGARELFDHRPTVVALNSSNALVIAGTERAHKVLSELIESLDRPRDDEEKTEDEGK